MLQKTRIYKKERLKEKTWQSNKIILCYSGEDMHSLLQLSVATSDAAENFPNFSCSSDDFLDLSVNETHKERPRWTLHQLIWRGWCFLCSAIGTVDAAAAAFTKIKASAPNITNQIRLAQTYSKTIWDDKKTRNLKGIWCLIQYCNEKDNAQCGRKLQELSTLVGGNSHEKIGFHTH